MQIVHLPPPGRRALILDKSGKIFLADLDRPGIPHVLYMKLHGIKDETEAGLISLALSPGWAPTSTNDWDKSSIFVFWAHYSQLRISKFYHRENGGGLSSQGDWGSKKDIWIDTDGYPGALHHMGGKLSWGPDGMLYLSLGDKYVRWCLGSVTCKRVPSHPQAWGLWGFDEHFANSSIALPIEFALLMRVLVSRLTRAWRGCAL